MSVASSPPERVQLRALTRFILDPATGCHVSTYAVSNGYARVGWHNSGKSATAMCHRAAWIAVNGPIPPDMTVDHVCKNRVCVNVEHLRLLSNLDNARRVFGWDWPLGQCRRGHSDEHFRPSGPSRKKGYCAECDRAKAKARWAKRGIAS